MNASLYVHIPFCARKCAYCDFTSYAGREADIDGYITALLDEARAERAEYGMLGVPTLYIGGGTPSLLSGAQLSRLTDALARTFALRKDAEITMEMNPGTVTRSKLSAYRGAGINRVSFGAQAYQDAHLRSLGRIHRWPDVVSAVGMAREAGFDNINLDLMYGLPAQTAGDWYETLTRALELAPEHLSLYSLIVEPGTPMAARVNAGEAALPGEDALLDMESATRQCLSRAGFSRYEISNYALPGYECRHNIVYWTRGNYLGLGCAAHSLMNETRFANPASLNEYVRGEHAAEKKPLSKAERQMETVMLETRLVRGLDLRRYEEQCGESLEIAKRAEIETLLRYQLIVVQNGFLSLTNAGMNVQNRVVCMLTA